MAVSRKLIGGIVAVLLLALFLLVAWCNHYVLTRGLPPRIEHANQSAARDAAGASAIAVLGTGSMAPFIPAAPAGVDPLSVVVAYAVPRAGSTFADVTIGTLCVYRPAWTRGTPVMHQAAQLTGAGWVMTGLANAHSEAFEPMTARTFVAVIASVHTWPQ